MARFSIEVETSYPDKTRAEIERALAVWLHRQVQVRHVVTSK